MSPLPPGPLRRRIENLTDSVGFPLSRIFVYEGTVRSLDEVPDSCDNNARYMSYTLYARDINNGWWATPPSL